MPHRRFLASGGIALYKLLIVDDEPSIRQGVRESVNWDEIGIEVVGEASNGLEALLLIHDLDPDILICDIRMPKLDGILLVNEAKPAHPHMQVIFLSGYSDKEYMKNAIHLDAVDYIFKPFLLQELTDALEKAKRLCLRARDDGHATNPNLALELLHADATLIGNMQNLPIDLHAPFLTLIVRVNPEFAAGDIYSSAFDSRLAAGHYYGSFRATAAEVFDGRCVLSNLGGSYVLHANVPQGYAYRTDLQQRLYRFFDVMQGERSAIAIGVSNLCEDAAGRRVAFSQAREAVHAAFLMGYGKVLFYRDVSQQPFLPSDRLQQDFYDPIIQNNFSQAIQFLDRYIRTMRASRPQDIAAIKDELASIAFFIGDRVRQFTGEERSYVMDRVQYASQLESVHRYLLDQIDKYVEHIGQLDHKGRILLEVERYIMQHYDKDLSIKTIASQVYITPNYLCHLYKKKTGRTLNHFILDVKMEHAVRMVRETDLKMGLIAEKLAYQNANYFARLFTKQFGMNPSQYRKKYGLCKDMGAGEGDEA